ncbi:MAG: multicopper oxidase domain-containing protein [Actinomycetota bacterium]|nr:multicopper oxidase domain-containing protein [Actinomycetota bacterium]
MSTVVNQPRLESVEPPENPAVPGTALEPFVATLRPPHAHRLMAGSSHTISIEQTTAEIHPDLPAVPVWGYGWHGHVTTPGPLLEVRADDEVTIRWRNLLPASVYPLDPIRPAVRLPFATAVLDDPDGEVDSVQNYLTSQGGLPQDTSGSPLGWTSTHLHGAHSIADSDGWPDDMSPTGGEQVCFYENGYDNVDVGFAKVGAFLWYHDHAMNGTRYHVYAGLAGGYLVRDPREQVLGLPTSADTGEIVLMLQDRNIDVVDRTTRLLHKTTPDTGEFFGPLTLVNGQLWPRVALRPDVYRLRLLNGSNARAYRLHLVAVDPGADGAPATVAPVHERVQVIGTDAGLLWKSAPLGQDGALTLAPAERVDVLVDLTDLADGAQLFLVNSAPAPFGGDPVPDLAGLWADGDRPGRNPFPWVLRIDVDEASPHAGRPAAVFTSLSGQVLSPAFHRLVHDLTTPTPTDAPPEWSIEGHMHHVVVLAETDPPGHLYAQELVADPAGAISLQLPGQAAPTAYRVESFMADDTTSSESRVAFYDRVAIRPQLGRWQVFTFVNATGDTHPMHIHQSTFQPVGTAAGLLDVVDAAGTNRYDPATRRTATPIVPAAGPGRAYEAAETNGWKDVIRVDPGNVVKVAIRFDTPGRYVYHCHVLEHEDTQMMRPFVVTVLPMDDGTPMSM